MLVGAAWSNLSLPAMCGCAAAAALLVMYLVSLGKRAAKCVLFVFGALYYTYLAWWVYDFLPYFNLYGLLALCAWGFACDAAVEAATGSVWSGAVAAARKAAAFVVNSFSSVAGNLRRGRGQPAARKVSSNIAPATATVAAPSEPAAPAPVKAKQVKKGKVPAKKIKTSKALERVDVAVPAPRMKNALEQAALALGKAGEAFDSAMEVVFTVVPVFDVLGMALKLLAAVVIKAGEAFDSAMEVVFTVVPVFDVAEMAIRAALKLAVVVAAGLGKATAALVKFVGNAIVAAVVRSLKELFKPVLMVCGALKFVFFTAPRWVWALFR